MDKEIRAVCVECGNEVESSYTRGDIVEIEQGIIEVFVFPCKECFPLSDSEIASNSFLKSEKVAELFDVSDYTLRQWRQKGIGPRYIQIGENKTAVVRYRKQDIQKFIAESVTNGDKSP